MTSPTIGACLTGQPGIFLSYRRDDADEAASLLQVCLTLYLPGTPVFRDANSIKPGANFRTEIDDAIRSSAVLLALIGPRWLTARDDAGNRRLDDPDDVLAGEITLALSLGVQVIPLLVKGAQMPQAEQLPWRLRGLAELQAVPLDHRNVDRYQEAVRWLAPFIERAQAESARARQAREQSPADRQVLDNQTPIPEFAAQIKRIRAGRSPYRASPANAMATLRVFAQQRPIDHLVRLWPASEDADGFAPLDVVAILTLAAVDRSAAEVAELAAGVRRTELDHAEQGPAGLTERIIHDLAAQRTVPGVAEFIWECERLGQADPARKPLTDFIVRETLTAFTRSASRVSLDKALLYFELIRFGCSDEADALLAETLSTEKAAPTTANGEERQHPPGGVVGEVGIVGALRHLSPQEPIVEEWLKKRVTAAANWQKTAALVANLLRNEPGGDRLLAQHVAEEWPPTPLIRLCEILAEAEGSESPSLRLVRRYAATRDWDPLADIVGQWYLSKSAKLFSTFPELLAEIVTGGADNLAPRPLGFLRNLATALDKPGIPAKCRSELLVAAATHVEHRPGSEAAELLSWVDRAGWWREAQSDQWRAAQKINAWCAQGLATRQVGTEWYVDYLKRLRTLPDHPRLIFWAVRELTDPTTTQRGKLKGGQTGRHRGQNLRRRPLRHRIRPA